MRRLIAGTITGLVTFVFLVAWDVTAFVPPIQAYALAALIAGVGAVLWPVPIGLFFAGRARARRREIQNEVDRQLAEQAAQAAREAQDKEG